LVSGTHQTPATNFPFSSSSSSSSSPIFFNYFIDSYGFGDVGRPL
jgi:hypothetical protein